MRPYFPALDGTWENRKPRELGFDESKFVDAISFVESLKTTLGRNLSETFEQQHPDRPPWNVALGPVRDRGSRNGLVIKDGYIVAEWGDTSQVDMASSMSKIFLNACVGLMHADTKLVDLDAKVADMISAPWFTSAQNAPITWRMLLQLTSEWEGSTWDVPDQVDRNRRVLPSGTGFPKSDQSADSNSPGQSDQKKTASGKLIYQIKRTIKRALGMPRPKLRRGGPRPLKAPGSFFEYNDIRVNRLSLCLAQVAERALPGLLAEKLMQPIGASCSWDWLGYRNAWVEIEGKPVQSVSGGSHWGGGMYISSRDLARFGLLYSRGGLWDEHQILRPDFIKQSFSPGSVNRNFGLLWWLNTDRKLYPTLPDTGVCAYGVGSNIIWIDPAIDLVVLARWYHGPSTGFFLDRIYRALLDQRV